MAIRRTSPWLLAGLGLLALLSAYYFSRAAGTAMREFAGLSSGWLGKNPWYLLHIVFAVPVLLGGPLQFLPALRARFPAWHRRIGKAYVVGASVAAVTAIHLGALIEYPGSKIPLVLLGTTWLAFTLGAWRLAVRREFDAHRRFMIRSYALALAVVWVRLMGDLQGVLFPFIADEDVRDTTREWLAFVGPLLVVEAWLAWWPALRAKRNPAR